MKPTYTLIMLDKPIVVSEETPKYGQKVLVNGATYSNFITEYRTSPCPPPYVSNLDICKHIIAGHEGTKRLTFQLSDEDAQRIGYFDVKGFAALAAVAKYPTLHNAEFKSDAAANVLTKLCRSAFELGAETALSITPKKYTEEQMYQTIVTCLNSTDKTEAFIIDLLAKLDQPKQYQPICTETENEIIITKIL